MSTSSSWPQLRSGVNGFDLDLVDVSLRRVFNAKLPNTAQTKLTLKFHNTHGISLECDFRFPLAPGDVITRLYVETGSDDNSENGELKPAVGVDTETARRLLNKESRGTSEACPGELSTALPCDGGSSSSSLANFFTVRMAPIPARCHRSIVVEYNTRVDFDADGVAHHVVPSSAGASDRLAVELVYHTGAGAGGGLDDDDTATGAGVGGDLHAPQLKLNRTRALTSATDQQSPSSEQKSANGDTSRSSRVGPGLLDAHKQRPRFVWHPGRMSTGHAYPGSAGFYRCFFERKSDLSSLEAFDMLRSVPAHRPSLDWQSPTRRVFDAAQKADEPSYELQIPRVHSNMTGSFIVIESPLVSPAADAKPPLDGLASSPVPSPTFPRGGYPIDVTVPSSEVVAMPSATERRSGAFFHITEIVSVDRISHSDSCSSLSQTSIFNTWGRSDTVRSNSPALPRIPSTPPMTAVAGGRPDYLSLNSSSSTMVLSKSAAGTGGGAASADQNPLSSLSSLSRQGRNGHGSGGSGGGGGGAGARGGSSRHPALAATSYASVCIMWDASFSRSRPELRAQESQFLLHMLHSDSFKGARVTFISFRNNADEARVFSESSEHGWADLDTHISTLIYDGATDFETVLREVLEDRNNGSSELEKSKPPAYDLALLVTDGWGTSGDDLHDLLGRVEPTFPIFCLCMSFDDVTTEQIPSDLPSWGATQSSSALDGAPSGKHSPSSRRSAAAGGVNTRLLEFIAERHGGNFFDLRAHATKDIIRYMSRPRVRLLKAHYDRSALSLLDPRVTLRLQSDASPLELSVCGLLKASRAKLTLVFGFGENRLAFEKVYFLRSDQATPLTFVRELWCRSFVDQLERFPRRFRSQLVELTNEVGILTSQSHYVVLQTVDQFIEHGVKPTGFWKHFRHQYERVQNYGERIEEMERQRKHARLQRASDGRIQWHARRFEDYRRSLLERRQQMGGHSPSTPPTIGAASASANSLFGARFRNRRSRKSHAAAPAAAAGEPSRNTSPAEVTQQPFITRNKIRSLTLGNAKPPNQRHSTSVNQKAPKSSPKKPKHKKPVSPRTRAPTVPSLPSASQKPSVPPRPNMPATSPRMPSKKPTWKTPKPASSSTTTADGTDYVPSAVSLDGVRVTGDLSASVAMGWSPSGSDGSSEHTADGSTADPSRVAKGSKLSRFIRSKARRGADVKDTQALSKRRLRSGTTDLRGFLSAADQEFQKLEVEIGDKNWLDEVQSMPRRHRKSSSQPIFLSGRSASPPNASKVLGLPRSRPSSPRTSVDYGTTPPTSSSFKSGASPLMLEGGTLSAPSSPAFTSHKSNARSPPSSSLLGGGMGLSPPPSSSLLGSGGGAFSMPSHFGSMSIRNSVASSRPGSRAGSIVMPPHSHSQQSSRLSVRFSVSKAARSVLKSLSTTKAPVSQLQEECYERIRRLRAEMEKAKSREEFERCITLREEVQRLENLAASVSPREPAASSATPRSSPNLHASPSMPFPKLDASENALPPSINADSPFLAGGNSTISSVVAGMNLKRVPSLLPPRPSFQAPAPPPEDGGRNSRHSLPRPKHFWKPDLGFAVSLSLSVLVDELRTPPRVWIGSGNEYSEVFSPPGAPLRTVPSLPRLSSAGRSSVGTTGASSSDRGSLSRSLSRKANTLQRKGLTAGDNLQSILDAHPVSDPPKLVKDHEDSFISSMPSTSTASPLSSNVPTPPSSKRGSGSLVKLNRQKSKQKLVEPPSLKRFASSKFVPSLKQVNFRDASEAIVLAVGSQENFQFSASGASFSSPDEETLSDANRSAFFKLLESVESTEAQGDAAEVTDESPNQNSPVVPAGPSRKLPEPVSVPQVSPTYSPSLKSVGVTSPAARRGLPRWATSKNIRLPNDASSPARGSSMSVNWHNGASSPQFALSPSRAKGWRKPPTLPRWMSARSTVEAVRVPTRAGREPTRVLSGHGRTMSEGGSALTAIVPLVDFSSESDSDERLSPPTSPETHHYRSDDSFDEELSPLVQEIINAASATSPPSPPNRPAQLPSPPPPIPVPARATPTPSLPPTVASKTQAESARSIPHPPTVTPTPPPRAPVPPPPRGAPIAFTIFDPSNVESHRSADSSSLVVPESRRFSSVQSSSLSSSQSLSAPPSPLADFSSPSLSSDFRALDVNPPSQKTSKPLSLSLEKGSSLPPRPSMPPPVRPHGFPSRSAVDEDADGGNQVAEEKTVVVDAPSVHGAFKVSHPPTEETSWRADAFPCESSLELTLEEETKPAKTPLESLLSRLEYMKSLLAHISSESSALIHLTDELRSENEALAVLQDWTPPELPTLPPAPQSPPPAVKSFPPSGSPLLKSALLSSIPLPPPPTIAPTPPPTNDISGGSDQQRKRRGSARRRVEQKRSHTSKDAAPSSSTTSSLAFEASVSASVSTSTMMSLPSTSTSPPKSPSMFAVDPKIVSELRKTWLSSPVTDLSILNASLRERFSEVRTRIYSVNEHHRSRLATERNQRKALRRQKENAARAALAKSKNAAAANGVGVASSSIEATPKLARPPSIRKTPRLMAKASPTLPIAVTLEVGGTDGLGTSETSEKQQVVSVKKFPPIVTQVVGPSDASSGSPSPKNQNSSTRKPTFAGSGRSGTGLSNGGSVGSGSGGTSQSSSAVLANLSTVGGSGSGGNDRTGSSTSVAFNLVKFHVLKMHKLQKNSPRVLQVDLEMKTISICRAVIESFRSHESFDTQRFSVLESVNADLFISAQRSRTLSRVVQLQYVSNRHSSMDRERTLNAMFESREAREDFLKCVTSIFGDDADKPLPPLLQPSHDAASLGVIHEQAEADAHAEKPFYSPSRIGYNLRRLATNPTVRGGSLRRGFPSRVVVEAPAQPQQQEPTIPEEAADPHARSASETDYLAALVRAYSSASKKKGGGGGGRGHSKNKLSLSVSVSQVSTGSASSIGRSIMAPIRAPRRKLMAKVHFYAPSDASAASASGAGEGGGNGAGIGANGTESEHERSARFAADSSELGCDDASTSSLYSIYLDYRRNFVDDLNFYGDCAEFFRSKARSKTLAQRIVSNILEIGCLNPDALRMAGYQLWEMGSMRLAINVFEKVLSLQPDERTSHRDLALALLASPPPRAASSSLNNKMFPPIINEDNSDFSSLESASEGSSPKAPSSSKITPNAAAAHPYVRALAMLDEIVCRTWPPAQQPLAAAGASGAVLPASAAARSRAHAHSQFHRRTTRGGGGAPSMAAAAAAAVEFDEDTEFYSSTPDSFESIVLTELAHAAELMSKSGKDDYLDAVDGLRTPVALRPFLPYDLRIVVHWNSPLANIELSVLEPDGALCPMEAPEHLSSRSGTRPAKQSSSSSSSDSVGKRKLVMFEAFPETPCGRITAADAQTGLGPQEYLLTRAQPGKYEIRLECVPSPLPRAQPQKRSASRRREPLRSVTALVTVYKFYGQFALEEKTSFISKLCEGQRKVLSTVVFPGA